MIKELKCYLRGFVIKPVTYFLLTFFFLAFKSLHLELMSACLDLIDSKRSEPVIVSELARWPLVLCVVIVDFCSLKAAID